MTPLTEPVHAPAPGGLATYRYPVADPAAPVVVAIHGFASTADLNWVQTGWVRALNEAGLHAVTLDLPGHGASPHPREASAYRLDRLVEGVVAALDHLGLDRPHVLGYSFGARLAWELATTWPERVASLSLGGLAADNVLGRMDLDQASRHMTQGDAIGHPATAALMAQAEASPGVDLEAVLAFAAGQRATVDPIAAPVPTQPMALVAGARDQIAPNARDLLAVAPHATYTELPGRNHVNAVSARAFKNAVIAHIGAAAQLSGPDRIAPLPG
jgi:pimeloyl-ACP methyl ester carboxylesterase